MPRILDKLHAEHIEVVQLLDLLSATVDRLAGGDAGARTPLIEIMHYMTSYPDLFHHPREDLLFARLVHRASSVTSKVELVTAQHRSLARDGKALHAAAAGSSDPEALIEPGRLYIEEHRAHMNLEEGELFSLARVVLSSADWADVDAAMSVVDDPLFGSVATAQYAALRRALVR